MYYVYKLYTHINFDVCVCVCVCVYIGGWVDGSRDAGSVVGHDGHCWYYDPRAMHLSSAVLVH